MMQDQDSFINRTDWFTAIAALTVWFAQFMLVWGASIIWPGQVLGNIVAMLLTLAAYAALAVLWRRVRPVRLQSVAGLGLAIATMAVTFSVVPALIG